jgi:hypothetical protein
MYIGFHVKYPLFSSELKLELSRQILEKSFDIKFHENLSSGSRVPCGGRTDGRAETNMTKPLFAILRTCLKSSAVYPHRVLACSYGYQNNKTVTGFYNRDGVFNISL